MFKFTALGPWLAAAICLALCPSAYSQPVFSGNSDEDINNIFPLAPRELRQRLSRAQTAVAEERFSDAVQEIGEILNTAGSDDFFLGVPGSADAQLSLKTEALALLGAMPAKGRRMYELQYGADAKVALESALTAGDVVQLTEVSRRYFQTKAGYEATILLGRLQLDQGRGLAAALTLKRVADVPTALAQYDPELSVLLATAWIHANQPLKAEETLVALKKRLPQAKLRLVDREIGLFARDGQALDWLQDIVGGPRSAFTMAQEQWAVYRGDERRNARSSGGVPLLNFNWKLPTVNDPTDEGRVAQQLRSLRDHEEPLIPALQPLVVHDYAIVRQPESNKLIGINLKKNGKREWVYPPFDENPATQAARQAIQANRGPMANSREVELRQRIWQDHVFGQVSSDGRQVYVLDELSLAPDSGVNIPPNVIARGGMRFPNPSATKSYNMLVALDLAKQGYQVWAVGGQTGDDNPALAGAFFLGPPLPSGDQLYAIAEFNGEIRLLCLDARTGALDWKQQLAVLENNQIMLDRPRRLSGASPSLADGVLICPTSAGAVVALDLATRTLRWGYQYRRNDVTQIRGGGFRGGMTALVTNSGPTWLDATATIAEGSVILTPPESQQLHCLDLLTGKARWSPIPRDDMLMVACVHKGQIILIGKNRLKAVNLADGKPAWENELKLDNEMVAGRGYYNDHYYYLPVTGQQLCKIDLDTSKVADRVQTEVELGNLVSHKDQLISLSPQSVASFMLLSDQLREHLAARLAANPEDVDALALKAQILLQEGGASQSLDILRRAERLAPDRPTIRTLLVKVMLALVRQDLATYLPLTDELDKLVTDPAQRREVLRYRVQGLVDGDRAWDAFQAILELADQELSAAIAGNPPAALQTIDRERSVRPDRWLQSQLTRLFDKTDSETRERMTAEIKVRLERVLAGGNANQLRAFLGLFSVAEVADEARLALVQRLTASDAFLEAEFIAGQLLERPDKPTVAAALNALAAIYEKAKRPEQAAKMRERLAREFAGVEPRQPLNGARPARATAQAGKRTELLAAWPVGRIDVKEESTGSGWSQRTPAPLSLVHFSGAAQRGLKAAYDMQRFEVTVRSESGQPLATAALRPTDPAGRRGVYILPNNPLTGQANGHLVVFNLGVDIVALDALRADRTTDALLWRIDATDDPNSAAAQRIFSSSGAGRNPLLGNRQSGYDVQSRQLFITGPVGSSGVVFQRGRQLMCVHPLTGETLWERGTSSQAEIPQVAELFGDDKLLFVADGRPDSKSSDALVLSALDGSLLGKRTIDPGLRRWTTCGRNVLAWEEKGSLVALRLTDAETGKELWSRQLAKGSRGDILDGQELALLEPGGQFTIVSLANGQITFSIPLEPEPALGWIQVIRSEDQYLLLASQEASPSSSGRMAMQGTGGMSQRGMHGRVYAFSTATGKLAWPSPAFVAEQWLPADQPSASPLLFFVAQRQNNNKTSTVVLALDRRTGEIVYDNELAGTMATSTDAVADASKRTVTLTVAGQGTKSLTFTFTDLPRPPQPPAQTGEMASSTAGQPAGVNDQSLGAAIQLLQRGLIPGAVPFPVPPFNPPQR